MDNNNKKKQLNAKLKQMTISEYPIFDVLEVVFATLFSLDYIISFYNAKNKVIPSTPNISRQNSFSMP
jgi:hypothetical protein